MNSIAFPGRIGAFILLLIAVCTQGSIAQKDLKLEYFLMAIEQEDTLKVQKYLDRGISVDDAMIDWKEMNGDRFAGRKSRTPLLYALELRKPKMVKYLVEKGADVNQSIEVAWYKVCDDCPYNAYCKKPQSKIEEEYTPLLLAIKWGNLEIIDYLISCGARHVEYENAIKLSGNVTVWNYFRDIGVRLDFNSDDLEVLYENYYKVGPAPIDSLLNWGIHANGAALVKMVERKHIQWLTKALDNGSDVNAFYEKKALKICPLCKAVLECNLEITKLLIEKYGANPNSICSFYYGGNTVLAKVIPFEIATNSSIGKCKGKDEEMIEYLFWESEK